MLESVHGEFSGAAPSAWSDGPTGDVATAIAELLHALKIMSHAPPDLAYRCIVNAAASLRAVHGPTAWSSSAANATPGAGRYSTGGLAPWMSRRVSDYIEAHINANITTADLASLVKKSVFHFGRAFRVSFHMPPHRYVTQRRIERAQAMMVSSERSLTQIALECGMSDQAHFNKAFRRVMGQSPGVWRREHANPLE